GLIGSGGCLRFVEGLLAFGFRMSTELFRDVGALLAFAVACSAAEGNGRPGDALFSGSSVPRFQLTLASEQLEQLRRDNRQYVRATVLVETNIFHDVGVRLKGHGSFRPLDD